MKGAVLVTGSRGFLGRFLVEELKRRGLGPRLHTLDRAACDLNDPAALGRFMAKVKPVLVYHLAGSTRPLSLEEIWSVHSQATINLLEALRHRPDARRIRVIVAGSAAEFGDVSQAGRVTEAAPLAPVSPYGVSKWCQSLAALSFRGYGLKVSIARIFNVLGPGMPEHLSLGSFAAQIARIEKRGGPARLAVGNLSPRRDYIDVRDAARALADLSRIEDPKSSYNICSGKARSMRELLEGLLRLSTKKIVLAPDPRRKRAADVRLCVGSRRRLTAATGWKPRIPLAQSLQDTLDSYR